ncbi:MAG: hypothetical protein J5I53_09805 [Bradyrhizobiaceae bacterium]|nr:hypothetical protein [Bradyrhizobiaceae bacterium]
MQYISLLLALVVVSVPAMSQRHWTKITDPVVGNNPRLSSAMGAAFAFDTSAAITYDQGKQWSALSITSGCKSIVDFVNNTTLVFAQPTEGGLLYTYYTVAGITWTPSDTLDLAGKHVVAADAAGADLYIATAEGWVYRWTSTIDSMNMALGTGQVRDFLTTPSTQIAITSDGLKVRRGTDNWQVINPPSQLDAMDITKAIARRDTTLYAATDLGVFQFDGNTSTWIPVGTWPEELVAHNVVGIATDNGHIIAMTVVGDGRHQLYRLDLPDTNWIPTGWEIPMDQPTMSTRQLIIDAGWAIAYEQSTLEPDSTGYYAYNLNDFTDVQEHDATSNIHITSTSSQVTIDIADGGGVSVDLYTITGERLHSEHNVASTVTVALPPHTPRVYAVVVRLDNGTVVRRLLAR